MSGFAEFGGGLLVLLGLFYRWACLLLTINMFVAVVSQLLNGTGLGKASQALEDMFSFLAAAFIGPGRYSLDELLGFNKRNED